MRKIANKSDENYWYYCNSSNALMSDMFYNARSKIFTKILAASIPSDIQREKKIKHFLEECLKQEPITFTLSELLEKSNKFPIPFPISSIKTQNILDNSNDLTYGVLEDTLLKNAHSSYPIIHENVILLIIEYLEHKIKYGSNTEKKIYKNLSIVGFIDRILSKRAVQFVGHSDHYQLLNGKQGSGGWENVGTDVEKSPLLLKDCLSYDEMKISALLAASCPSIFINAGGRTNRGVPNPNNNHQIGGIVIGVVGCRFENPGQMEWQDMIVSAVENTKAAGYGENSTSDDSVVEHGKGMRKIWANFYGETYFPTWDENPDIIQDGPYIQIQRNIIFNSRVYKKRCILSAQTILLEANQRGEDSKQKVFLHIVGYGLGVWQIWDGQKEIFLDGFIQAVKDLELAHISDIYFSWFDRTSCDGICNGEKIPDTDITIHFGKREPHSRLEGQDKEKLLVVTYAWDSNSLPGNEFWGGELTASGDPAQASSSQIAELQNPHINGMITGSNVRIASPTLKKLVKISEFVEFVLKPVQTEIVEDDSRSVPLSQENMPCS